MKNYLLFLIFSISPLLGFGQILQEGFDNVAGLTGWTITNQSDTPGSSSWYQGNPGAFFSYEGATNSYILADYNSTSGSVISTWLISPAVNVKDGDVVSFYTRTTEDTGFVYNSRMEMRMSSGTMIVPSTGHNDIGSFSMLMGVINDGLDDSYPHDWMKFEYTVSGLGSTPVAANFAFRYNVSDAGPSGNNSDYIGIDSFSVTEGNVTATGCFSAPYGQFPSSTFIPPCFGMPAYITNNAWAGEYTKVQLTAGVEYTFRSSTTNGNDPDFITIALENEDVALASGTGSVTYTSPVDQIVRFFSHKDENCTAEQVSRLRTVQCGVPFVAEVPEYPCFQGDGLSSNGFETGYNVTMDSGIKIADDFVVDNAHTFKLQYIRMNLLLLPYASITDAKINILADENGVPNDSNALATISELPTSMTHIGYNSNLGFNIWQVEYVLDMPINLATGKYWLQPEIKASNDGSAYWEMTSTGSLGNAAQIYQDGVWFTNPDDRQAVFFVAGECDLLGVNKVGKSAITYYPNPVKDKLNITSKNAINKISVYDLVGQLVMSDVKMNNGQIDVSRLPIGTYMVKVILENGKMENFKILKK
ncbi:MAG: T9SS type A sorting domain-containing protein [Chryseobacterium sp.]|nr:T9SS type A sorting domain-containing protein [Chryseobacterium sp.]